MYPGQSDQIHHSSPPPPLLLLLLPFQLSEPRGQRSRRRVPARGIRTAEHVGEAHQAVRRRRPAGDHQDAQVQEHGSRYLRRGRAPRYLRLLFVEASSRAQPFQFIQLALETLWEDVWSRWPLGDRLPFVRPPVSSARGCSLAQWNKCLSNVIAHRGQLDLIQAHMLTCAGAHTLRCNKHIRRGQLQLCRQPRISTTDSSSRVPDASDGLTAVAASTSSSCLAADQFSLLLRPGPHKLAERLKKKQTDFS